MLRSPLWVTALLVLGVLAHSTSHAYSNLTRLTWQHEPGRWELFRISPNPFSPVYQTEFSIPVATRLRIDVFSIEPDSDAPYLIRQVEKPEDHVYRPAVYSLDLECLCDSLGLPVSQGLMHLVRVQAFEPEGLQTLVFEDSLLLPVIEHWSEVGYSADNFEFTMLKQWQLTNDDNLVGFGGFSGILRLAIAGARYRQGSRQLDPELVIKLVSVNDNHRDPFRRDARAYVCVQDTASSGGFRVLRELSAFHGQHSVWGLSLKEGELLMVNCAGYWPVVINASHLISSLNLGNGME